MCVFVRADIFEMVLEQAREPDKIHFQRIAWNDRDRLRLLADSRLLAATGSNQEGLSPDVVWQRFFVPTVYGAPVYDYIFAIILSRPRDLLYFLRSAISSAVNRRHEKVQEDDFVAAEEDYSEFVYQSMFVELREKIPDLETVLSEFMGGAATLTESEISAAISKASPRSNEEIDALIAALALSSFFAIEAPSKGFSVAADDKEYVRLYRAAANASERTGNPIRFRIQRAFHKTLLIEDTP